MSCPKLAYLHTAGYLHMSLPVFAWYYCIGTIRAACRQGVISCHLYAKQKQIFTALNRFEQCSVVAVINSTRHLIVPALCVMQFREKAKHVKTAVDIVIFANEDVLGML